MEISSPAHVAGAFPTLVPLVQLLGHPQWQVSKGTTKGCTLASLETASLPTKAFRMSIDVSAGLETLVHVLTDPKFLPDCDPTLARCEVLETHQGVSLVYTAQRQQSVVVAPRDFCVRTSSVMVEAHVARSSRLIPESLRLPSARDLVFMLNSVSESSPRCEPGWGGPKLVRGHIHVFGYIAYPVSHTPNVVHVDNYCCVEAGGSIPNWLVNAAIAQNCEKLRKIAEVAARVHRTSPVPPLVSRVVQAATEEASVVAVDEDRTRAAPLSAPVDSTRTLETSTEATAALHTTQGAYLIQPESEVPPPLVMGRAGSEAATAGREGIEVSVGSQSRHPPTDLRPPAHASHGIVTPASTALFLTPVSSYASLGDDESGMDRPSALAAAPAAALSAAAALRVGTPDSPRTRSASSRLRDEAIHSFYLSDDAKAASMVCGVAALARSVGWTFQREEGDCVLRTLEGIPAEVLRQPFMTDTAVEQGALAAQAGSLRAVCVSTVLPCGLPWVREVMRSSRAAPLMDPDLQRLTSWTPAQFAQRRHSHHRDTRNSATSMTGPSVGRSGGSLEDSRSSTTTTTTTAAPSVRQPWHLRHYVHERTAEGGPAFDAVVCCTDVDVPRAAGAALGLHAAGLRAGSYVWGGLDASDQLVKDPHHVRRRATVMVFGCVAVAVPVTAADAVRLSHYALFSVLPSRTAGGRTLRAFTARETEALCARVAGLALARVQRLRSLLVAPPAALTRAMGGAGVEVEVDVSMLPLDARPLLTLLETVDEETRALAETSGPGLLWTESVCEEGVAYVCFVTQDGSESAAPRLGFHLTVTFPCSVDTFSDVALCAERTLRCLDVHTSSYTVLHTMSERPRPGQDSHTLSCSPAGERPLTVYQIIRDANCALAPGAATTVMESTGHVDSGAFIIARVNCDVAEISATLARDGAPQATVWYDGYVVRPCARGVGGGDGDSGGDGGAAVSITRHFSITGPSQETSRGPSLPAREAQSRVAREMRHEMRVLRRVVCLMPPRPAQR